MALFKVEVGESQKFIVRSMFCMLAATCAGAVLLIDVSPAQAQVRYASSKRSNAAIAHYARARAMCVETLEEFEVGRKHARPNLLLDPEEWRLTMISLCEQLNRLVDPKIRVSNDGIQVNANPRLIKRAKDQLPEVADGPKIRSDYGELARLKEKQDARARMYSPEGESTEEIQNQQESAEQAAQEQAKMQEPELSEEELIERAIQEAIDSEAEIANEQSSAATQEPELEQMKDPQQIIDQQRREDANLPERSQDTQSSEDLAEQQIDSQQEQDRAELDSAQDEESMNASLPPQTEAIEIPNEAQDLSAEEKQPADSEDAKIASAIEDAIQKKLREIEAAGSEQEAVNEAVSDEEYSEQE